VQIFPFYPPWAFEEASTACSLAGLGAGGGAGAGVIKVVWVSLSLAIATTSAQTIVAPWRATFAFLTCSNSPYISRSRQGMKQCKVASALAAIDLLSYSTRRTKLAELSLASGLSAKYFALN
jgi:hypothetical protein